MTQIRSRNIWLLTALVVVGFCIQPVWRGVDLIGYSMTNATPDGVHPWVAVSGVAFAARRYALTSTNESSDDKTIAKRRDELAEMLVIRPLSSYYWLQLAESRITTREASTKAADALELSFLTGSNEGYMITQRGMFGIWQWEKLPTDWQKRAVADLAARGFSDSDTAWLKATLAEKPEQVRQEIRLTLQAQGFSKGGLARIGL